MSGAQSRRLDRSLGDSWGYAEYESDSSASIHTASELGSDVVSESDLEEASDHENKDWEPDESITPVPSKTSAFFSTTLDDTPVKPQIRTPANRVVSPHSQTSQTPRTITRSHPGSHSAVPSFIMPTMEPSRSTPQYYGSPARKRSTRVRQPRTSQMDSETQPLPRLRQASGQSQSPQTAYESQAEPRQRRRVRPVDRPVRPAEEPAWDPLSFLNWIRVNFLWPVLRYALNVVGITMEYLKPVIAACFAIWLFVTLFSTAQTALTKTLSPICHLPLSSYVVPFCAKLNNARNGTVEPEFESLMELQESFEQILKKTEHASYLPRTMKDSELAVRGLKTLVQYSKLPSKQQFVVEFESFIDTAKEASQDLTRYNQKIGAAVDKIITTNRWTINTLNVYQDIESGTGKLQNAAAALNPLNAFRARQTLQSKVFDQYIAHISANKEEINKLIEMGIALLKILNSCHDRLDGINELAVRDKLVVDKKRDEVLSHIWTKLGGNKSSRKELERQMTLLKDVGQNNWDAIRLVTATVLKLQEIAAGLEELKDTVETPELVGYREDIPIARYIELVDRATERLQDARGESHRRERDEYLSDVGRQTTPTAALPGRKEEPPMVYAKTKAAKKN